MYSNPEQPEGINYSREHPLKEFFLLSVGLLLIAVAVVTVLSLAAHYFARYIPFAAEERLANLVFDQGMTATAGPQQDYLQSLADKLLAVQSLPEGMKITVHYVEDETVNAYATLGGHIVIYSGLLNKLRYENGLAMVLAHEIAHIKHRDPIRSLGRGVTVALALSSIVGFGDNAVAGQMLSHVGFLTAMSFSRDQETAADRDALEVLQHVYGHVQGADEFFTWIQDESDHREPPALFSSHPVSEDRLQAIIDFDATAIESPVLIPLPDFD